MSTAQVTGTDGVVPIYDPDGRWQTWSLEQIFVGGPGTNMYVPNPKDYVVNPDTNEWYKVAAVDQTTLLSTLVPLSSTAIGAFDPSDLLMGVGPGTQSDTYRCYLDTSVMPYRAAVDVRLQVAGTMASYAKVFRGAILGTSGQVISAFYDQSGNLLGENVPLELVATDNVANVSIKVVKPFYTKVAMVDGEIITVVIYAADGTVLSKRQLLVENTAYIRTTDASEKYVTGIAMSSPFLSSSDPTTLQYPINVPKAGLNLMGIVEYSDGTTAQMPVDGTKFSLMGLDNYVATIVGQKFPLVLKYSLSANEIVYGASANTDGSGGAAFITESFKATTLNMDGAYTVKLFCVPVFIDSVNGWRLDWYLFNLDRNVAQLVTPYVKFATNSPAFLPKGYGVNQQIQVQLTLSDVNPSFKNVQFTETIGIILNRDGTDQTGTNWTISYDPGQTPAYGANTHAVTTFVNQNLMQVKIDQGLTDQEAWLDQVYYPAKPLTDPTQETMPPVPNMFSFVLPSGDVEFPISQWNSQLALSSVVANGGTLLVKFFLRTSENDLELALCPMPVWQSN
ncbi:hypothetical protein [Burkholderia phage FLC9]|nr:hypothetical protein [Burkholderia phage FLC9]